MQKGQAISEERLRGDLLLTALSLGLPVAAYNFLLIERKYSVVLGRGAFLQVPLAAWEKVLYALLLPAQIVALILTGAALLRWLLRRLSERPAWTGLAGLAAASAYFATATIQFEVYRYFKDGIDLGLARNLGGGDLGDALDFVKAELVGLLPLVLAALGGGAAWVWVWRRYGARISTRVGASRAGPLASRRGILLGNAVLFVLPGVAAISDPLAHALDHSAAHRIYRLPLAYGSDFDGDGYGLLTRPLDQAPFDGAMYPYALEVPGNGIDENGVGGDLARVLPREPMPAWDAGLLARKSVLIVVLESARNDLLEAEVGGQPAMPHLRDLAGQRLRVISHLGFTAPGICGVLKGAVMPDEPGVSLIDRFHALGYRTGIFSGQPEDFNEIAKETGMDRADVSWDASDFPAERRMYTGSGLNSLVMPGELTVGKFREWIGGLGAAQPFFAYYNIQEMHFPYNSEAIPATLVKEPIPRDEITPENRDWLRRTYCNAAHRADAILKEVLDVLRASGRFEETVVLVVGDHGEELFDDGYLGHGVNISYEQNETICKLVNGAVELPADPIGISDLGRVVHNALLRGPEGRLPLGGRVMALLGGPSSPRQVGLFDASGLRKYDFLRGAWLEQKGPGAPFRRAKADPAVIHAWESYALTPR
jgi:hypothetical protein